MLESIQHAGINKTSGHFARVPWRNSSGETVADPQIPMAGLLADGLNLGLTRMAEACTIASLGQLT